MVMAHPVGPPQSQAPPAHHPLSGPSDRERGDRDRDRDRDRAGPSGQAVIRHGSSWFQRKINLRPQHRGGHLITDEILKQVPEIQQFAVGLLHIQIMHTSASLALNENWDPDVRDDVENFMNKLVPENLPYQHSCEGPDDMPAHIKSLLFGSSLSIPITDGRLNLGQWQGVWLCEHRNRAGSRKLVITINGSLKDT